MAEIVPVLTDLQADGLPLDQNPAAIYLAGLRESGRRSQRQVLDLVAGLLVGTPNALACTWSDLRFQHLAAIRTQLEARYKPATVNKALSALRGTLRAAWLAGQMSAEAYQKAASVKSVKNTTLPVGRELSIGELSALMQACENDVRPAGVRDAAIIGLMYAAGLRRDEVVNLSLGSYDVETGKMIIRGKGNKERSAYLSDGAGRALIDWLKVRDTCGGDSLFVAISKSGKLDPSESLTPQAIYNMLGKRALQAGVSSFSPHDLRRTFVSDLLDSGADIVTVAKMAGHASVTTTARYDRRPEEVKRKAANLLHVPYRGRRTTA